MLLLTIKKGPGYYPVTILKPRIYRCESRRLLVYTKFRVKCPRPQPPISFHLFLREKDSRQVVTPSLATEYPRLLSSFFSVTCNRGRRPDPSGVSVPLGKTQDNSGYEEYCRLARDQPRCAGVRAKSAAPSHGAAPRAPTCGVTAMRLRILRVPHDAPRHPHPPKRTPAARPGGPK